MTLKRFTLFLFVICFFASSCGQKNSTSVNGDVVITVNNYKITHNEFESEFKASLYGDVNTPESRRDFANTLIDRKLILQYAQKEGLDKEKNFLRAIEKFWEQSLVKVALDRKAREIELKTASPDWAAKRAEEAKMMSDWVGELRQEAQITIKDSDFTNVAGQKRSR